MSKFDTHVYAVILAGGSGTRFWPRSRQKLPKQLCRIGDQSDSMIEVTLSRLEGLIPPERRIIVTHVDQAEATRKIVGNRAKTVISEAAAKDTGHALALASIHINTHHTGHESPIMISLHADAVIKDLEAFQNALSKSVTVAETGAITLMGIIPTYAETGYGYIEQGQAIDGIPGAFDVRSFREKPDAQTAEEYYSSKKFSWNSGIFTWKISTILQEFEKHMKPSYTAIKAAFGNDNALKDAYLRLPKISIDQGVLEKCGDIKMVAADIGWQDVGSWDAMPRVFETDDQGNFSQGPHLLVDTKNSVIDTDGPYIAALGIKDMVVVASNGAILVCPKERSQDIKKVVELIQASGRNDLL